MAVLGFSTTVRDRVCYTIFANSYSGIGTREQGLVDSAGVLAMDHVRAFGAFFIDALTVDPAPPQWEAWLHALACYNVALTTPNQERIAEFRRNVADSRQAAVQTYSFSESVANTAGALSLLEIQRYVVVNLVNRDLATPSTRVIDYATQWAMTLLWNRKDWSFRRRPLTLTIGVDSSVTADPVVEIRSINTKVLYYEDASGCTIQHVSADVMSKLKSEVTQTGRPEYFRIHTSARSHEWQFSPEPDDEYVVRTEVLTLGPPAITTRSSGTPFAEIPIEFNPIVLDLVLGKVLVSMGERGGNAMLDMAMEQMDTFGPSFEDIGKPVQYGSARDVHGDAAAIMDPDGYGGVFRY